MLQFPNRSTTCLVLQFSFDPRWFTTISTIKKPGIETMPGCGKLNWTD